MRYYVTADIHGFYMEFQAALQLTEFDPTRHTSCGHSRFEGKGTEFDPDADFSPYYAPGIIALDACTAYSGRVNIITMDD